MAIKIMPEEGSRTFNVVNLALRSIQTLFAVVTIVLWGSTFSRVGFLPGKSVCSRQR